MVLIQTVSQLQKLQERVARRWNGCLLVRTSQLELRRPPGPLGKSQVGLGKLTTQEEDLLGKALEVLRSKKTEGAFDQALKSSIEALHAAIKIAE